MGPKIPSDEQGLFTRPQAIEHGQAINPANGDRLGSRVPDSSSERRRSRVRTTSAMRPAALRLPVGTPDNTKKHDKNRFVIDQHGALHDAANILSGIRLIKTRLLDTFNVSNMSSEQENLLEGLDHSVALLGTLLHDILSPQRFDQSSKKEWVDVSDFLYTFVNMIQVFTQRNDIAISIDVSESLRGYLNVHQLEFVLMNLLLNAYKFVPENGKIQITASELTKEENQFVPDAFGLSISIRDNGPGISPEDLPYIFEPYYTKSPNGNGMGLGLCVVKSIVNGMNGEISVTSSTRMASDEDSFTQFDLILAQERRHFQVVEKDESSVEAFFQGRDVLYLDDEKMNRDLMGSVFGQIGVRCQIFSDTTAFLEKISELKKGSVLILDFSLNESVNGVDLAKIVHGLRQDLHVFILSGHSYLHDFYLDLIQQRVIECFLVKPYKPKKLLQQIRDYSLVSVK